MRKTKWVYNKPLECFIGTCGGNYIYRIGECYFSYNPSPNENFIDAMFGVDTGEETAFYDAIEDSFIILLGDFREEIEHRSIDTYEKAIEFLQEKYPQYGGEMTTDERFNKTFI